jgi:hypothetical protein
VSLSRCTVHPPRYPNINGLECEGCHGLFDRAELRLLRPPAGAGATVRSSTTLAKPRALPPTLSGALVSKAKSERPDERAYGD